MLFQVSESFTCNLLWELLARFLIKLIIPFSGEKLSACCRWITALELVRWITAFGSSSDGLSRPLT